MKRIYLKYEKTLLKSDDYHEWGLEVSWDWRRNVTFRKCFHNFFLEDRIKKIVKRAWEKPKKNKNWKYAIIRVENKDGELHSRMQIPFSFIRKIVT